MEMEVLLSHQRDDINTDIHFDYEERIWIIKIYRREFVLI